MQTRKSSPRHQEPPAFAGGVPARFLELALKPAPAEAGAPGYEISWPSGVRLRVPAGFCPEELALVVELLREEGGEG